MSDQRTSSGYRGALPPRDDRLARPWIVTVVVLFLLMFALTFAGLPSSLIPEETPLPLPSVELFPSADASPEASATDELVSPAPEQ